MGKSDCGLTVTAGGLTIDQHRDIDRYLRNHKAAYIFEDNGHIRILSPDNVTRISSMSAVPKGSDEPNRTYLVRMSIVVPGADPRSAAVSAVRLLRSTKEYCGVVEVMNTDGSDWNVFDPEGASLGRP